MSSAPVLFDMRISGSTRASAFMAGSSDGNTLSVTAMIGRGITNSNCDDSICFQQCGELGRLPLPDGERGWGEGVQVYRESRTPHPNPLPMGEGARLRKSPFRAYINASAPQGSHSSAAAYPRAARGYYPPRSRPSPRGPRWWRCQGAAR